MMEAISIVARFGNGYRFLALFPICLLLATSSPFASAKLGPDLSLASRGSPPSHATVFDAGLFQPASWRAVLALTETSPTTPRTLALRQILSSSAAAHYRRVFAAIARQDLAAADQLLADLPDPLLRGTALAERYLARRDNVTYDQLLAWMVEYADLPQAYRIEAKARKLQPAGAAPLPMPVPQVLIKGQLDDNAPSFAAEITLTAKATPAERQLADQLNRLLRADRPTQATTLLKKAANRQNLSLAFESAAQAAIAAGYFFLGDDAAAAKLSETIKTRAPLALWIGGLKSWRDGDYAAALSQFRRLVEDGAPAGAFDRAAAAFWAGRSAEKLGDRRIARRFWVIAAEQPRSFYGILAHRKLERKLPFTWEKPVLTSAQLDAIAARPAGKRALALLQIGERDLAAAELRRLHPLGNQDVADGLVALAQLAELPALALQLGSGLTRADGTRYDDALFPLPPWQAEGTNQDRALLYAVMRQESRFNPQAISHRGAQGLMQLMPRTASVMLDDDLRARSFTTTDLRDPQTNVTLGQRYLQHLALHPDIDRNLPLVLAAYNGGPGNLMRWLRAMDHQDDSLLFIETMPMRETRDYVERVLAHYWIYRDRLQESQPALQHLADGIWPTAPSIRRDATAARTMEIASQ